MPAMGKKIVRILHLNQEMVNYIAVNFEKFNPDNPNFKPRIRKIRFGWLDHTDWHSQGVSSGQQASIRPNVRDNKLKLLYNADRGGRLFT